MVGNWIRVNLAGWGGARDQFGIHEVVHILTVLAVLPGEALLDGPCGREIGDTAIPRRREYEKTIGDIIEMEKGEARREREGGVRGAQTREKGRNIADKHFESEDIRSLSYCCN